MDTLLMFGESGLLPGSRVILERHTRLAEAIQWASTEGFSFSTDQISHCRIVFKFSTSEQAIQFALRWVNPVVE